MKKLLITFFTIIFCLTSSVGWSETMDDLIYRGISPKGTWYKKFSDIPFTGEITGKIQTYIKNGKYEGQFKLYHDNGQLHYKTFIKNSLREGQYISYYENGVILEKGVYKKNIKEGTWYSYYDNGQLSEKAVFVNNKKEGFVEHYNSDGSKGTLTGNYKMGFKQYD
jgi:antitoxin component YwqK of YwqJK toxin-antitoxin module